MISHCYAGEINEAIANSEAVIANSDKKGLSIERETFMLK
ncbi:MAG: hypothetical protein ACI910_000589 [Oleispira sp.]|jgi:hypothetical protein